MFFDFSMGSDIVTQKRKLSKKRVECLSFLKCNLIREFTKGLVSCLLNERLFDYILCLYSYTIILNFYVKNFRKMFKSSCNFFRFMTQLQLEILWLIKYCIFNFFKFKILTFLIQLGWNLIENRHPKYPIGLNNFGLQTGIVD